MIKMIMVIFGLQKRQQWERIRIKRRIEQIKNI